jgi:hypothetical protein
MFQNSARSGRNVETSGHSGKKKKEDRSKKQHTFLKLLQLPHHFALCVCQNVSYLNFQRPLLDPSHLVFAIGTRVNKEDQPQSFTQGCL